MLTSWDVYWITRLDVAQQTADCLAWLSFFCLVGGFTICALMYCRDYAYQGFSSKAFFIDRRKFYIPPFISLMVFAFLSVAIPTTNQFAAIYLLPKIANNEQVQKLPDNAMKLLNGKMEEWINDIGKKK